MIKDILTPDAGTVEKLACGGCGVDMEVTRNNFGRTSFGSGERHYDLFVCPHKKEGWHLQIMALKKEAKKTPSARLQKLFEEEISEVLRTRQATKKVSELWEMGL